MIMYRSSMLQFMKRRILFALVMGFVTTTLISFVLIAVNVGINRNFMMIWFRSWCLSYMIAVFAMLVIAPKIQSFIDSFLKND